MLCVSGVDEGGIPAWGRRITVRFFGGESRAGRNYPDPDGSVPEIRFRMRSTWGVFRTHAICTEWIEYRTDAQVKTIAAPITTTRRPFQRIRNWRKLSGAVSPIFAQQYYEILTAHRFIQMSGATGRRQDATDAPWRLVRAALQLAHSGRPGRVDIRAPQVGVRRRRLPALSLHSVGRICLHIIPFLRPQYCDLFGVSGFPMLPWLTVGPMSHRSMCIRAPHMVGVQESQTRRKVPKRPKLPGSASCFRLFPIFRRATLGARVATSQYIKIL